MHASTVLESMVVCTQVTVGSINIVSRGCGLVKLFDYLVTAGHTHANYKHKVWKHVEYYCHADNGLLYAMYYHIYVFCALFLMFIFISLP